ncbi:hypothetical protein NP493_1443g00076 [Ridgeia piscesae]|uniref:Uncharacterized protein n=1 Tax=Ridgeia piscesae TaxID=27915 RepID=A0AAD9K439_RIDPI|nr:hypothetical protein NP493_1443g00076 [Ridgeia piscesae]
METMISPHDVRARSKLKKLVFFGLRSFGDSANNGAVDFVQWIAGDSDMTQSVDQPRPFTKVPTVNMLLQATNLKIAPGLMNGIWLMPPTPPVHSGITRDSPGMREWPMSSTRPGACHGGIGALSPDASCDLLAAESSLSSDLTACSADESPTSASEWDNQCPGVVSGDGSHDSGSSSPCLTFLDDHRPSTGARRRPRTFGRMSKEMSLVEDVSARRVQIDQELPFRLNFYYSRRLSAPSVCQDEDLGATTPSAGDETSPVSSTDELDAVPSAATSSETFAKYIPLLKTCPPRVPKILLNKRNRNEWKDIQTAFLQSGSGARPKKSRSDSSLSLTKAMRNSSWRKKFRHGRSTETSAPQPPDSDCGKLSALKKKYPGRFDLAANEKFCRLNACKRPDLTAVLYIQLPPGHERTLNLRLCHVKTELAVAAMLHFLYPYCQVQCLWVQCLQDNLDEFLRDSRIKPRFSKFVYLRHFDAVLVLSEDAAGLLRHTDTCFVRALAAAIGVSVDRLLVLVRQWSPLASESFD